MFLQTFEIVRSEQQYGYHIHANDRSGDQGAEQLVVAQGTCNLQYEDRSDNRHHGERRRQTGDTDLLQDTPDVGQFCSIARNGLPDMRPR